MKILTTFCIALLAAPAGFSASSLTAQQVIDRIKEQIAVTLPENTVDTFKAGNPETPVKGIAVTMMATEDVLERAAASGKNLIITHEPTFYGHLDKTAELERQNDAVLADKQKFIADHQLVVWRFHDGWHKRRPDGILLGMTKALGWEKYQSTTQLHLFTLPETKLSDLASDAKRKLGIRIVRVVGEPDLKVSKIGLMPGAAGSQRQIELLEKSEVEVLVIGETPEWETVEYVADAATQHKHKALLILGHIPSEQAGMEECARWLPTFIPEVPISFIAAKEPFWPAK